MEKGCTEWIKFDINGNMIFAWSFIQAHIYKRNRKEMEKISLNTLRYSSILKIFVLRTKKKYMKQQQQQQQLRKTFLVFYSNITCETKSCFSFIRKTVWYFFRFSFVLFIVLVLSLFPSHFLVIHCYIIFFCFLLRYICYSTCIG